LSIFKRRKVGAFGGAGVGKTVVIMELINNIAKATAAFRCSPEWASGRAKVTISTRNERGGRDRPKRSVEVESGNGLRPDEASRPARVCGSHFPRSR